MTNRLPKIPYGVADYTRIREEKMTYVDKTRFIAELEEAGNYLFFLRPRRSGKSLIISTLYAYYDRFFADEFEKWFGDSWIGANPTAEKNQYLVLSFNFAAVNPEPDKVEASFEQHAKTNFDDFLDRYREDFKADFIERMHGLTNAGDRLDAVFTYCRTHNLKLYVFIDEYDNFANTILSTRGEAQYHHLTHGVGFFRYFFNVLKLGTDRPRSGLSRLFITGVSPVTMDDVTSGFNIGIQISLEPQFQAFAGFTEAEVVQTLKIYDIPGLLGMSMDEVIDVMREWYGGYHFTKIDPEEIYNPDMVLYFTRAVTRFQRMPDELIDLNVRTDYHKLHHLIQVQNRLNGNFNLLKRVIDEGSVSSKVVPGFPLERVTRTENFVSLLYFLGLLTFDTTGDSLSHKLRIPNRTVTASMYDYLRTAWLENDVFRLQVMKLENQLATMARHGDWKPFFQTLADAVRTQTAIRDFMNGEKVIQGFLLAYLCTFDFFLARSEHELNKGFCDIFLEPFTARYPEIRYGYLIELKYFKRSELTEDLLKDAINEAKGQLVKYKQDPRLAHFGENVTWICPVLVFHGWELVYYDT
ncbi:MAG: AAA family ATPase [Acidobacteriota bacterium]|nr:AAA family ATPase [Acidobacteriota bacterium]